MMNSYKEMSLRDIQKVSLDILKVFHDFCVSNNIRYSIGYGTLIGAVRHKGFIPWDDDVDVVMLREDYNKFINLFRDSENYKLFSGERRNMYGAIARLCEIKRTRVDLYVPLFSEATGVWIDIFPMDYIEEDHDRLLEDMQSVISAHRETIMKRCLMRSMRNEVNGLRSLFHWIKMNVKYRNDIFSYVDAHLSKVNDISSENGGLICQFGYPTYNERDVVIREAFDDVVEVNFEGSLFYAMKGYDLWLKNIYGDYMKLPPKEDRIAKHGQNKYYWISD